MPRVCILLTMLTIVLLHATAPCADNATDFYEKNIRPLLAEHCYECHSEEAGERQGGLLLDRRSGWIAGGDTQEAVLPGNPDESLLVLAVEYGDDNLQMPPDGKLSAASIALLKQWVRLGAPGPVDDPGDTEFSRLGDQTYLFEQAKSHWAFQPIAQGPLPVAGQAMSGSGAIDHFIDAKLQSQDLSASPPASTHTLARRLAYDLTGLPPSVDDLNQFRLAENGDRELGIASYVDSLLGSPAFGEHFARMWLDVARYADTDGAYRPDTKTPHYFPFAFTYRDYVVGAFCDDKPIDQFIREQLAADLMGFDATAPELAALGFLTVGPHANRNALETIDDWIDVTTRGLLGLAAACARCHDHKYEPIPTEDYYSLHGVFSSVVRVHPLDESKQPQISGYTSTVEAKRKYQSQRKAIDKKISDATGKKSKGNNRSVAEKIRETELAELLLFHPGAPARAMVVTEKKRPVTPVVFVRGQPSQRGAQIPRRFLRLLDPKQQPFPSDASGRLELADHIASPNNPLTARVFVNRVWGMLMGSHLVATPSDFGLRGAKPTHPELLDWLAADFISHQWSLKHLVRTIVLSKTYQQASVHRQQMYEIDPENQQLWRANRKRLSVEALRDSMLCASGQLDSTGRGRPGKLWESGYSRRRALYGYINRFNLDPTLRAFDFPTPMQSQPGRNESIVPTQTLFTMNAPFVIEQSTALAQQQAVARAASDSERIDQIFLAIFQRRASKTEQERFLKFVGLIESFQNGKRGRDRQLRWPLAVQALFMSNEFQYVD